MKGIENIIRRREYLSCGVFLFHKLKKLLNTVLTVRAHQANSHRGKGWEEFTDAAIRILNEQDRPIVFILWGSPAQKKAARRLPSSPVSARGGLPYKKQRQLSEAEA